MQFVKGTSDDILRDGLWSTHSTTVEFRAMSVRHLVSFPSHRHGDDTHKPNLERSNLRRRDRRARDGLDRENPTRDSINIKAVVGFPYRFLTPHVYGSTKYTYGNIYIGKKKKIKVNTLVSIIVFLSFSFSASACRTLSTIPSAATNLSRAHTHGPPFSEPSSPSCVCT